MRIISGFFGGRKIAMDGRLPIRPTSDMARGALFSSIAELVPGARVLDIFAGTGAVGIEALSRGALEVIAIEQSPKVATLIMDNCRSLGITPAQLRVKVGSFERELAKLGGEQYEIIFADPPYSKGYGEQVLELVSRLGLLSPQGIMIIEHFNKDGLPKQVDRLKCIKVRNYGQTLMSFFAIKEEE